MNRDSFVETLRTQYSVKIREIFQDSGHRRKVDYSILNTKLEKLMKGAMSEGLPPKDFDDLVRSIFPELMLKKISITTNKKIVENLEKAPLIKKAA